MGVHSFNFANCGVQTCLQLNWVLCSRLNGSHTCRLDSQLNSRMKTITGCVKSIPTRWLLTLSHIPLLPLRRQGTLVREYRKILDNRWRPVHVYILAATSNGLKSIRPVMRTAKYLRDENFTAEQRWQSTWNQVVAPEVSLYLNPKIRRLVSTCCAAFGKLPT